MNYELVELDEGWELPSNRNIFKYELAAYLGLHRSTLRRYLLLLEPQLIPLGYFRGQKTLNPNLVKVVMRVIG